MLRPTTLLAFLLWMVPSLLSAGNYSGRVTDEITGDGLAGATVTCLSGENTETDAQGFFSLTCRQPKVLVQMTGFADKVHVLQTGDNIIALVVPGYYEVGPVRVTGNPDEKKVQVSKQRLQKEAVGKTTSSLFPDVARVVQSLPGVTADSDFSGLLYVRGGDPHEVVAVMDDMIIMSPYLWGGRLTVFNPNLVESVDFYAGGYPAEANQALSALLDVKNKTGNTEKYTGLVDLSAATANVVVEGPLGLTEKSSFILGLRRTHYDLIIQAMGAGDVVYPYFYDGQAKCMLPLSNGRLEVQSLFSYEGMDLTLSEAEGFGDDHPEDTRFHYLSRRSNSSVSYDHRLSDRINILTLVGLRFDDSFYTFSDFYTPSDTQVNMAMLQARHVWQILLGDHHIVKSGFYVITGDFKAAVNSTVKIPTPNGYYLDQVESDFTLCWPLFAGLFAQDDMELFPDALFINPGINAQYYSGNRQWVINPRLALKWNVLPAWEWHLATGIYSQHPMEANWLDEKYGNPALVAQEAAHYILGSSLDFGAGFHFQAEAYYKVYRHLLTEDPDPDIRYTNNTEGYAYGGDFILQKKLGGNWDGWLTYSYVHSRRKITSRSDPEDFGRNTSVKPVGSWFTSENERTHALSLILNYEIAAGWQAALTQKIMTGAPFTPVVGAGYVAPIDEYVPQYGRINSARFPAYNSTDLKITFPFFGIPDVSAYLQITNVFDIKNVDQYYYNRAYTKRKELYQLPRMFIGGIRWDF
ncbi:TonB-dependent receptor plug domain-containing protein [candidate division FCPU426 bacterium]|nr:TonB-dependent receptor plug domain-containing protein [candidate division FCPU426 bacterium]